MPYTPSPHAAATSVDETTTVVLHLSSQAYFELNAPARRLWDHLQNAPASEAELIDVLAEAYEDADRDAIARDVRAFLQSMQEADLIQTTEPADA